MSALAVIQLRHLGTAYTLTNAIFANEQLKHLETCPMNGQALVLFQGPPSEIIKVTAQVPMNEIVGNVLISEPHEELLNAYYSLVNCNPKQALVILEADFVGKLLQAAMSFLTQGWHIMELRVPRAANSRSHLILTGEVLSTNQLQNLEELKKSGVHVTVVSEISSKFKQFLSLM